MRQTTMRTARSLARESASRIVRLDGRLAAEVARSDRDARHPELGVPLEVEQNGGDFGHHPQLEARAIEEPAVRHDRSRSRHRSRAAALPVDGVGLLRAELMIVEALGGVHPRSLLQEAAATSSPSGWWRPSQHDPHAPAAPPRLPRGS